MSVLQAFNGVAGRVIDTAPFKLLLAAVLQPAENGYPGMGARDGGRSGRTPTDTEFITCVVDE